MHITDSALQTFLQTWGYLAVLLVVGLESTGIPLPGETMLIVAATYAGTGHLQIPLVIGFAALGAILGDNLGYWVGREGGRRLVLRYGKYVRVDEAKLANAERFFDRHGDKTVFLGRFVALLRTWAAFLAGLNRMHWPTFFLFNAAGGICWATLYGVLAFELGKNLPLLHRVVDTLGIAGVALAVLAVVVLLVLHFRAARFLHRGEGAGPQSTSSSSGERADGPP